ncbi:hypothetical protein ACFLVK_01015 [Chloroflexota bacterium]
MVKPLAPATARKIVITTRNNFGDRLSPPAITAAQRPIKANKILESGFNTSIYLIAEPLLKKDQFVLLY